MIWVIVAASALALAVFFERLLLYHSEQINSTEFLNGVRNVLKRDNVVEAIAICDATPGPVARLVKVAILNRERGREAVREALEDAGRLGGAAPGTEVQLAGDHRANRAVAGVAGNGAWFHGCVQGGAGQRAQRPCGPAFAGDLAGADLHGGGAGGGDPQLRGLQLPGGKSQYYCA